MVEIIEYSRIFNSYLIPNVILKETKNMQIHIKISRITNDIDNKHVVWPVSHVGSLYRNVQNVFTEKLPFCFSHIKF